MATMILIERNDVKTIADIYRARQMNLAKLAAKKELVSMSTAIDAATAKGNYELSYRLSGSITKLKGEYYDAAMAIINADIEAAGYTATEELKNGVLSGFKFGWGEAEEEEPEVPGENPVDPNGGNNGENGSEGGSENGNEGGEGGSKEGGNGGSEGGSEEGGSEGGSEGGNEEGGSEGGEGSGEGGSEGSNENTDDKPQPRVPQVVEDPTENGLYTLRQLKAEDFVNGMDVLPDGIDSLDDLVYLEEPYDAAVGPYHSMHDLPFRSELMYFVREFA